MTELRSADARLPDRIRAEILATFHDEFKVARLEGSGFPQSLRPQVLHDYRATIWCLPAVRQAAVVHVFSKSSDPTYRRALAEHDARLEAYFSRIKQFADLADRRRACRGGRSAQ